MQHAFMQLLQCRIQSEWLYIITFMMKYSHEFQPSSEMKLRCMRRSVLTSPIVCRGWLCLWNNKNTSYIGTVQLCNIYK